MPSRWPFSFPLWSSESGTPGLLTHVRLITSHMREMAEVYFHIVVKPAADPPQLCCFKLTELQLFYLQQTCFPLWREFEVCEEMVQEKLWSWWKETIIIYISPSHSRCLYLVHLVKVTCLWAQINISPVLFSENGKTMLSLTHGRITSCVCLTLLVQLKHR